MRFLQRMALGGQPRRDQGEAERVARRFWVALILTDILGEVRSACVRVVWWLVEWRRMCRPVRARPSSILADTLGAEGAGGIGGAKAAARGNR